MLCNIISNLGSSESGYCRLHGLVGINQRCQGCLLIFERGQEGSNRVINRVFGNNRRFWRGPLGILEGETSGWYFDARWHNRDTTHDLAIQEVLPHNRDRLAEVWCSCRFLVVGVALVIAVPNAQHRMASMVERISPIVERMPSLGVLQE